MKSSLERDSRFQVSGNIRSTEKLNSHVAQVVQKTLDVQDIINDVQCSENYAQLKMERVSTWLELRAVARILDSLKPDWLEKTQVPADLLLQPLSATETMLHTTHLRRYLFAFDIPTQTFKIIV